MAVGGSDRQPCVNLADDLQTRLAQRGRRELLPQVITELRDELPTIYDLQPSSDSDALQRTVDRAKLRQRQ